MNKLSTIKRYKYLPFDIGSLKILTQGTIKFTKPSEFNDPFDCDPGYEIENIEEYLEHRPDLVKKVANFLNLSGSQILKEKPLMAVRLRNAINHGLFGQPASDNVGICCLTKDPLNLLMWAHYADNHKGFVVEFNIPIESFDKPESEVEFFELLIPHKVNYSQKKPIVNFHDSADKKLVKQFLTKGKDWEYEQEERVVDYIRRSGIHSYKREIILFSVIAGSRMEDSNYDLLKTILYQLKTEHDLEVNLYKASQVPNAFELHVEGRPDLQPYSKTTGEIMKNGIVHIILYLSGAIDNGKNKSLTLDTVKNAVADETIFEFLENDVISNRRFEKEIFSEADKQHITTHWKNHLIDWDFEKNYGIENDPLCVLLALSALTIQ